MRIPQKTYNPCDDCLYGYSKQNQESSMCRICEFEEYCNLEKQGLLLRLPCKIGDTVYYIDDYEIYWDKASNIDIRKENGEYIFCIGFMDYKAEDFGKTVFLTKAEAEEALKKMEESKP